ncbi:excinuclease ABC subunit A [Terriglobus roseus]|uniref:UvrABC system protein A n=1 Tax=Terriglobus roseus TaxID=392734 RepID=A0A1G7HD52_9BACT|nr:excinuclease ABC subunit A [Terriglobus roseus]
MDVGPAAGAYGGEVLYSGPLAGLKGVGSSETAKHLFANAAASVAARRNPKQWLRLEGVTRNNLHQVAVSIPLDVLVAVTGVSGSGKSTLVSQALVDLIAAHLGQPIEDGEEDDALAAHPSVVLTQGRILSGMEGIRRLVRVDQRPIGRTPRSNIATYTGLFDEVRKLFASTKLARTRKYDAGRFSFNVTKGRCETCKGEGQVCVELLFLPSVYSPCPTCHGARFNAKTLEVTWGGKNIAEVLNLRVDDAIVFFDTSPSVRHSLQVLHEVGLGYLRLGQPATELSGGEAQRVKLATELQRATRGNTIYVLDEPTTGLHPADVTRLLRQLNELVSAGNSVVIVEHDMHVVAASDWVIDIGPGAGEEGGTIVGEGTPEQIAHISGSRTAPYIRSRLGISGRIKGASYRRQIVIPSETTMKSLSESHQIETASRRRPKHPSHRRNSRTKSK